MNKSPMDHAEILNEFAAIIRGEVGKGDRIYNAESYIFRLANDMPEEADALALDVERNESAVVEITGLSPGRVRWVHREIRRCLAARAARNKVPA